MALSKYELDRHMFNKKLTAKTRQAVKDIVDCANINGSDEIVAAAIAAELCHTHRTLQSSFLRAFNGAMVSYSEMPTDLRNKSAVDFAKKVKELEHYFPFV